MTPEQFKDQFNLLYNNINNNAAPGLSDAEISSFLNKAQNEIVKQHVLGPATVYQLGINQTSKRDVELDSLVKTIDYKESSGAKMHINGSMWEIDVPQNTNYNPLIILSEIADNTLSVIELSYTQFNKFMAGVYKYPKKSQCWKIRHDSKFEIIAPSNVEIQAIKQVYVEMPQQIAIDSTNDYENSIGCALPEVLHDEIVQRAVELAKAAYASQDVNIQMSMGQRSE